MTEVHFYHLDTMPLDRVLPTLLEKVLERGWRAVVHTASAERTEALAAALWTYREESFLPPGTPRDGHAADQPVWLTEAGDEPNSPAVRVLVDGLPVGETGALERVIYVFDGRSEEELAQARAQWREARARGLDVVYWQQDQNGRWNRKQ